MFTYVCMLMSTGIFPTGSHTMIQLYSFMVHSGTLKQTVALVLTVTPSVCLSPGVCLSLSVCLADSASLILSLTQKQSAR